MQKYQVFIDEHSISIVESRKSNQQSNSTFELLEPTAEEIKFVIDWLLVEQKSIQEVFLITNNPQHLWEVFQQNVTLIEAAGGVVENEKKQFLFIHRLGKWDLPKGKMERSETPEQSAVREVEEECGVTGLKLAQQLPDTYHIYSIKDKCILKRTYWFRMRYNGNELLVPQTEESIDKAVWVSVDQLEEQLANTYSSLKGLIAQMAQFD